LSYTKSLIIILNCLLGFVLTNCGHTILSTKSELAKSTKNHPEYILDGQWTKLETVTSGIDEGFGIITYYLIFVSNSPSGGSYGVSFDNPPIISGNYTTLNDTLTFINDYFVQKFNYTFKGKTLMLNLISLERFDEKIFPLRLEGKWSRDNIY